MNTHVLSAVFKRNFSSYFLTPTGYLFITVFVMLSSFATIWPNEFFNANLANLDQLSYYFPFIMLVFIPAITMGIWADEARQGTDELLLTIPAGDLEIVLGKYLAGVAIYTVSLLFSLLCNYVVIRGLGDPDAGLFVATYFGYWLLGLAMLAVGMVASFLTRNLTVAYVLGAVLNAPLVFTAMADALPMLKRPVAVTVKDWSLAGQFHDFGRGMLSLSGLAYFGLLIVVMLYLCMVLIGRRHWVRSGAWHALGLHFAVRALALAVIMVGVVYALHHHDVRVDATSERLSSLSPHTIKLVNDLRKAYDEADVKRPVRIEAFVSPEVPETYIQTRLNLLTTLRELQARAGSMMELEVNDTERAGQMAELAKKRYNITARDVTSQSRGAFKRDHIFMGVAMTCGLEKVVLPFIDRGIPVEYELVRSLCTVTQQKRKRIGVVETDAPVFGRFSMQGMSPNWPIVTELQKQYEVVQVHPSQAIPLRKPAKESEKGGKGEKGEKEKDEGFDVLLAIQPSAMGPPEMENFLAAVRAGQPTVIFEDPFTMFCPEVPGTSQPRHPNDQMAMFMQRQGMPKGTKGLRELWRLLGVNFSGDDGREDFMPFASDEEGGGSKSDEIVWQRYNPFPKLSDFIQPEHVFIDRSCGLKEPFCDSDPISSKLQHLFFPAPGYIEERHTSELKDRVFTPLVRTSVNSGTIRLSEMILRTPFGAMLNPYRRQVPKGKEFVLAAHITGRLPGRPPEDKSKDAGAKDAKKPDAKDAPPDANINVVLVADIDMLTEEFFHWREQGDMPGQGLQFDFDNVTLVLNALDALAGDERFLELRKRRPQHRTLTRLDERTEDARKADAEAREKCRADFDEVTRKENEKFRAEVKKLRDDLKKQNIDQAEAAQRAEIFEKDGERRLKAEKEESEQKTNEDIQEIDDRLDAQIRQVQGWYKMWAVLLPPILPLCLAGIVFFARRAAEREGVSRTRLK
jgi:ABC-2 type transport system permease protein